MGLSSTDGARWIAEYTTLWSEAKDDELVRRMQVSGVDIGQAVSKVSVSSLVQSNGRQIESYNPYFMNDAGFGQEVTKSFREYETFKILQREIDPTGFFQRAGGFKY